jgi:hypothetical protein
MALRRSTWFPIAFVLSAVNFIWVPLTASQPGHAAAHLMLGIVSGAWALILRRGMVHSAGLENSEAVETLFSEVNELRKELSDLQERLDFTERLLARRDEAQREWQSR